MAMPAGLVAFAPHIDLEGLQPGPAQRQSVLPQLLVKSIARHRALLIATKEHKTKGTFACQNNFPPRAIFAISNP
jgi:hypothetical protein